MTRHPLRGWKASGQAVDARVDPAAADNYALRFAAQSGHNAAVDRLLQDERVDPAAKDNYAICVAAGKGHAAVVERSIISSSTAAISPQRAMPA